MIDKVLILGLRRGGEILPASEISQMVGRCGRSYTESGEATVVVPAEDEDGAWSILNSRPGAVRSRMGEVMEAAFHFLPEVKEGASSQKFSSWFSRSLAFRQGACLTWEEVEQHLLSTGCARRSGEEIRLTDLGSLACECYLRPDHAFLIDSRVSSLPDIRDLDALSLSWILAVDPVFKKLTEHPLFQEYVSSCAGRGLWFDSELQDVSGFIWMCLLTGSRCREVSAEVKSFDRDLGRMLEFVRRVFSLHGQDASLSLEKMKVSVERKIPQELSELALEFKDARRSILIELDSFGVRKKEDLIDKEYQIEHYATTSLKTYLRSIGAGGGEAEEA